jgi:hypothetical protein
MTQEEILTAEEFLSLKLGKTPIGILPEVLIEFTKLHVEAALKTASEAARDTCEYYEDEFGDMYPCGKGLF